FGIKLCPARPDRKLTTIQGRPLTIKISVLKWNAPATWERVVGCSLRRKVGRLRYHRLTVKHRTITRQFNLRNCDNTNALVNKPARREVRSGQSATLACDGFAVPP